MAVVGRRIRIRGTVQGVGFRPWVYRLAREGGLAGSVRNDTEGVSIEAFGDSHAIDSFLERLEAAPPPAARIRELQSAAIPAEPVRDFRIVASAPVGARRVSIPPDLSTCDECAREIFDPTDRRYGYAFTNCTHCGPRFTILRAVPYDRPGTTMARFGMCTDCRREYEQPDDRRFHAQPDACPVCGPRLFALLPDGQPLPCTDPLTTAVAYLDAGLTVALKGIGGFRLVCDATSPPAVSRLRERKHRDEKPFAVMVRDLAAARRLARFDAAEEELLTSVERPIVLVRRREDAAVATEVAPHNPLLGLLLPYSPLHHLLLAQSDRPLVMTSGNLSDEPIAHRNDEALSRLRGIADLFLVHDRDIQNRCDDSVARVIAGRPVVFRRARGYVPRPVALARPVAQPVLACGAQLKNTFCIAVGDTAYLGPHVGDLENLETLQAFEEAVERLERLLDVKPRLIAHDLHPAYLSTAYALRRRGTTTIGVQHHHAHVASAMAEHGLAGPVIGVAYDGTGYGTDGTSWGGEVLLAGLEGIERVATFRPLALAGGDTAIRQVWRIALALLEDACDGEADLDDLPLFRGLARVQVDTVRRMLPVRELSPLARGVGRYFDAVGAIVLARTRSRYEGQVAMEWNLVADPDERGVYPFALDRTASPCEIDLRPLACAVIEDLRAGTAAAAISGRFHNTLARATAEAVRAAAERAGRLPVVLTGGVFQNALLTERVLEVLRPDFDVRLHGEVPPGDGGLALGQALVADAISRGGRRTACV